MDSFESKKDEEDTADRNFRLLSPVSSVLQASYDEDLNSSFKAIQLADTDKDKYGAQVITKDITKKDGDINKNL